MSTDNSIFTEARAAVKSATKLLDRLEAQVEQAKLFAAQFDEQRAAREQALAEHQRAVDDLAGQLTAERVAHADRLVAVEAEHAKKFADLSAAQQAEQAAKADALSRREAALQVERKEIQGEWERISSRERWVEHRAQDLTNRGAAA
jgi:hypothetical protein